MAILTTVVGAICALASQQLPSSDSATGHPFHRAEAFPKNATVIASWNPATDTPWPRIVEALPRELQSTLPRLGGFVADRLELSNAELDAMLGARGSLGIWADAAAEHGIGWLFLLDCGERANAVVTALERVTGEKLDAGLKIATLRTPTGLDVAFGRHHDALLFGSSTEVLEEATIRLERAPNASQSVHDNIRFQRFLTQCKEDVSSGDSFVSAYVDVSNLLDAWISMTPTDDRDRAVSVRDALRLGQVFAFGYFARNVGDKTHEHVRVCFPEPRTGIPALLAGPGGTLDAEIANFVPDETPSLSLFHLDTAALLPAVLDCLSAVDANGSNALRGMLRSASADVNVDIETDVLASLGRRFAVLQWPGTTAETAVVASLKNPLAISGALERTRMFKKSVTDGFETFHSDTLPVSVAIGEGNLIVSTSDAHLRSILDRALSGAANEAVTKLIENAPTGTTSLSTTDMGAMFDGILSLAGGFVPARTSSWHRYLADVLPSLGTLTTYVTSDAEGLSMHSHSSLGTLGTFTVIGIAVASSLAGELDPSMASGGIARRAEFAWRLGEIASAVRANDATSLNELVEAGTLDESIVGTARPNGDFVVDGYRITLFADARSDRFAVVAWPDDETRGDVYACFEDCAPMVNEILTHGAGMARVSLRDVYFDGIYGAQLMTGWKHIAVTEAVALETSDAAVELTGEEWNSYQLLVAAADGTLELEPLDIIGHLRAPNPVIVGRAAMTIAELKLTSAIPTLGDVAPSPDVATRRQIAKTLLALDDRSTLEISREMLRDPDPTVRAFAAANAGKHQDRESVESLLDVVVRPDPTEGDADRVQAFLTLADLGDPACLDTACASPTRGAKQGQALAYLMQKLSPSLGPKDEARLLMQTLSHEASIVRRYAIQRLGELRDPTTATALEGRLGRESAELRPLIEVSLSAIRGTNRPSTERVASLSDRIQDWYGDLGRSSRNALVSSVAAFALVMAGAIFWVFLRRRRNATDWAAMAAPSEEYAAEHEEAYANEPYLYGQTEDEDLGETATRWGEEPDHSAFDDYEYQEGHEEQPLDR